MKKISYFLCFTFLNLLSVYSQNEPTVIEGFAQGTTYHITYLDTQKRNFQPEIDQLLKEFDLAVSTYNPNSTISKINSNQEEVIFDKYFITCFKKAKEVWKKTNGAFDPTVYSLTNAWGFGPGKKLKIEKQKIDSILNFVGFDLIRLKGNKIIKKDSRIALDFNAFAQGYSVDVVSEFLNSKNISSYIVEIGGEVFAKGKNNNDFWRIGIEQPYDNKVTGNPLKAIAKIENKAIATSGNNRRFFIENGIKYAHHIDPKTGYPAKNNLLSASVIAKDCITADAYATGILVMGLEKAKLFLKKHPKLQAYLVYSDENGNYKVYQTSGLKSILSEVNE